MLPRIGVFIEDVLAKERLSSTPCNLLRATCDCFGNSSHQSRSSWLRRPVPRKSAANPQSVRATRRRREWRPVSDDGAIQPADSFLTLAATGYVDRAVTEARRRLADTISYLAELNPKVRAYFAHRYPQWLITASLASFTIDERTALTGQLLPSNYAVRAPAVRHRKLLSAPRHRDRVRTGLECVLPNPTDQENREAFPPPVVATASNTASSFFKGVSPRVFCDVFSLLS